MQSQCSYLKSRQCRETWLFLPEPKTQRMAGLAETWETHDKYSKRGLETEAKGISRVCMAIRHAAVKACLEALSIPKPFLYPGFYESRPHCNDLDLVLCCMFCSLSSSGDEASTWSQVPALGLTWAFFRECNCHHTQLLVVFPADKGLHS